MLAYKILKKVIKKVVWNLWEPTKAKLGRPYRTFSFLDIIVSIVYKFEWVELVRLIVELKDCLGLRFVREEIVASVLKIKVNSYRHASCIILRGTLLDEKSENLFKINEMTATSWRHTLNLA